MNYFEYGYDLDEQQRIDNENYQNKEVKNVDKEVGKGSGIMKPIPVDELMLTWKPTEWIVNLFGATGSCVLLAGDKGSGKSVFMYRMAEAIQKGEIFMTELETKKSKVFIWQADESRNNAKAKIKLMELKKEKFCYLFKDDEYGHYLDINVLRRTIKENKSTF